MTLPLIETLDGFETVRNKVADILNTEIDLQMSLADAAGKNPDDWKIRVAVEQPTVFDQFLRDEITDNSPIVNVRYSDSDTDLDASDLEVDQMVRSIIYLDVCATGRATGTVDGHIPADREAAFNASRAARIVRQIVMHGEYVELDLPDIVGRRYIRQRTSFVPSSAENVPVNHMHGIRLQLEVDHLETIKTEVYANIEEVFVEHREEPDGPILSTEQYNYV